MRSKSFKEDEYYGECPLEVEEDDYLGRDPAATPCWGQVSVVDWQTTDDDEYPLVACEGHEDAYMGWLGENVL